jgi:translation initiation factor 2 subunit 1
MRREKIPDLNELVLFKVTSIDEIAVYGTLIEYNNISAMMIFAEVSARRIKSIYQHVKEGQEIVSLVTQLDKERGYINLSRKQVTVEDKDLFMVEYANRKKVNTILYKLSLKYKCDIADLYKNLWPLLDEYDTLYIAFKCINKDNTILNNINFCEDIKTDLLENIEKLCAIPIQSFSGEIKLHCFHVDGVDLIREAIKYGIAELNEKNITVHYLAAPLYEIRTMTTESKNAEELFNIYTNIVNNYIKDKQGYCQFSRMLKDEDKKNNDDINIMDNESDSD